MNYLLVIKFCTAVCLTAMWDFSASTDTSAYLVASHVFQTPAEDELYRHYGPFRIEKVSIRNIDHDCIFANQDGTSSVIVGTGAGCREHETVKIGGGQDGF